jgi:Leucine-rich repeat (LRR) protein
LFLIITAACLLLALVAQAVIDEHREQAHIAQLQQLGATVSKRGSEPCEFSFARKLLDIFASSYAFDYHYGVDFRGTTVRDKDLAVLENIQYIRELDLSGTQISDQALRHFRKLTRLRKLDLGNTPVTDAGIKTLAKLPGLASLRVVGTRVSYDALEQLDAVLPWAHFCEERAAEELESVGVQVPAFPRHVEIDQQTVRAGVIANHVIFGMNRQLSLKGVDVSHLDYLESLEDLTFHTVSIEPDSLARIRQLPNLREVGIWVTNISDRDLEFLARQTQLEELSLSMCPGITGSGVTLLKSLTNLKELDIRGCDGVDADAIDELRARLPNCQISYHGARP